MNESKSKALTGAMKASLALINIPTAVVDLLLTFFQQSSALQHLDEITWEWISDLSKDLRALLSRVSSLESKMMSEQDAIPLLLIAWNAALRTTQQHKRDCLRRGFLNSLNSGKAALGTKEYLLNLVAQLDDLDLLVLAELGRRTEIQSPKDSTQISESANLPKAGDFELVIPDTTLEVRLALIEGSLRLLTARGLAIDATAVLAQTYRMAVLAVHGGSVPVYPPCFVVTQLGMALINFAISA